MSSRRITNAMVETYRDNHGLDGADEESIRTAIAAMSPGDYRALKAPVRPQLDTVTIPLDLWKRVKEVVGAAGSNENPVSLGARAKPLYKTIRNI